VVRALRRHRFKHFTLSPGVGYGPDQGGKQENAMVIWVAIDRYTKKVHKRMMAVADDICEGNGPKGKGQTSVLLVRIPAYPKLVAAPRRPKGETIHAVTACLQLASDDGPYIVGDDGKPLPSRKRRAAYRGKVLASSGEWGKLLGEGNLIEGRIIRFFPD
jgi:hypothetical protein